MAEDSARDRRAASREKRRSNGQDDSANGHEGVDAGAALKAAASAALAGAAVGAAHAVRSRRASHDEEPEQEQDQQPEEEQEPEPQASEPEPASDEGDEEEEPPRPMHGSEAQQIVERARQQIRDLRGAEAESVSSIRRTSDGWCVALEIVELHRIPDSTDVLGSYSVVLDDDGNLLTLQRTARYYRSEADRGER